MKLRSGTIYWCEGQGEPHSYPPVTEDLRCEVLVLGAGITGALAAYRLAREGMNVVLLDQREVGRGSTAASTGLLQYEIDTPLVELIELVGVEQAVRAYRAGRTAIDDLELLVAELGVDCGFARRDSLYFASKPEHLRGLEQEHECRRHFGFPVEFLSQRALRDISSIDAPGAIRSFGDGQVNALALTRHLVAAGERDGLRVRIGTPATEIEERGDCVLVHTPDGTIHADAIVYATGYESGKYVGLPRGNLQTTYVATSQPGLTPAGWPDRALVWETARPYFYARQTEDGRAMIGGEDTEFSDDHQREGLVEEKVRLLVERFHRLFPDSQFEAEYAWAGTFSDTKDGLAYIGRPAGRERAYFALGFGGNGITFSAIATRLIVDLITGRPNPDAAVFRFGR